MSPACGGVTPSDRLAAAVVRGVNRLVEDRQVGQVCVRDVADREEVFDACEEREVVVVAGRVDGVRLDVWRDQQQSDLTAAARWLGRGGGGGRGGRRVVRLVGTTCAVDGRGRGAWRCVRIRRRG